MLVHVFLNAQQEHSQKILHFLLFSTKIKNVKNVIQLVEPVKVEMMMIVSLALKEDSSIKINVFLNAQMENMEIHKQENVNIVIPIVINVMELLTLNVQVVNSEDSLIMENVQTGVQVTDIAIMILLIVILAILHA